MNVASKRPGLVRVVTQSARHTPNLIGLGIPLTAAMIFSSGWLVIAGVWLYVLLIIRSSANPRFWRHVLAAEAESQRQLPDDASVIDPALRLVVRAIRKGYDEIARVLRRAPEPIRAHVAAAVASLDDLRGQAARLVRDADELSRYLRLAPREVTESEIRKLNDAVANATDRSVRIEYQGALSVRQDQLAAVTRVAIEHERVLASLQFIVGTIEAFPAWIYRLRVLESRAKDDLVSETNEQLTRMKLELAASQHLLEGLDDEDVIALVAEPSG